MLKLKHMAAALALMGVFMFIPSFFANAATGIPFGGRVLTIQACNTGLLLMVQTAYPPGVTPIMWLFGELPFLDYVPPHPGQEELGILAPVLAPCVVGTVAHGAGLPIEFHGESF